MKSEAIQPQPRGVSPRGHGIFERYFATAPPEAHPPAVAPRVIMRLVSVRIEKSNEQLLFRARSFSGIRRWWSAEENSALRRWFESMLPHPAITPKFLKPVIHIGYSAEGVLSKPLQQEMRCTSSG